MTFTYPVRVPLARLPTPLEPMPRLGDLFGVELYIKRDDLTGVELSGNKIRKLEFLLAEALDRQADTVITCGGEQSNHCRATAFAAARSGLACRLVLRTSDPGRPPALGGNLLLDRLAGADIVWISPGEYERRDQVLAGEAESLRRRGRRPYVIPEGGSNALGAWGYVRAAEELGDDLAALPATPTTVVYPCGSGGTGAGLLLGTKLHHLAPGIAVAGVNVCDDRDYFVATIGRICSEFAAHYQLGVRIEPAEIDIVDGYVGLGYGRSRPEELALIRDAARADGILLDPVYTGKALYGVREELRRNRSRFADRIVFVHTGGSFALFAVADAFASVV